MFETVGKNLRICEPVMKRLRTEELGISDFEIENITGDWSDFYNHIKSFLSIIFSTISLYIGLFLLLTRP
jgi:hypothetical protein